MSTDAPACAAVDSLAHLIRDRLGITQVDAVVGEDGSVILWGYGEDGRTFIAAHDGDGAKPDDWLSLPVFRWRRVA